jgi:ATP-dependent DNA helicase MPH1
MASSDFDYTFDELDSEVLDQIDKIDAAHTQASAPGSHNQIASTSKATPQKEPPPTLPTPDSSDSFDDFAFDIDDDVIAQLDNPIAGPSKLTRQTTLDGRILPQTKSSSSVSRPQPERTRTSSNPFGKASNKTKKWDMTAFAKTGLRPKAAARRKRVNREEGDEEFEDEEFEFEQFPAPFVPSELHPR